MRGPLQLDASSKRHIASNALAARVVVHFSGVQGPIVHLDFLKKSGGCARKMCRMTKIARPVFGSSSGLASFCRSSPGG
jgi:hypothetical protein